MDGLNGTDRSNGANSIVSSNTGFPPSKDSTWSGDLYRNMNGGFGSGESRNDKHKSVREGREKGEYLPKEKGLGRTGKQAMSVPDDSARTVNEALRIREDEERKSLDVNSPLGKSKRTKPKQSYFGWFLSVFTRQVPRRHIISKIF